MSMTINTGDDADELDDDLDEREDDERDDDDSDEDTGASTRKPKRKAEVDDDEDDDDKSPEDLKAEVKRLRASLSKANSSGNRRRQQLKELRSANAALADKDEDDTDDDDDEETPKPKRASGLDARAVQRRIERARKETRKELEKQHQRDLIDTRAESALTRAGVSEKNIRLLKRELDYDDLELDPKSRTVDGLDDEVDRLRSEFPDLFRGSKAARRRINGGDDRTASRAKGKPMSASERQAASIRGH